MSTRRWLSAGVALVVAGMLLGGCAGAGTSAMPLPPTRMLQPADLASLAGEWHGTLRRAGGPGPASIAERSGVGRVTVAPDGAYTSNFGGAMGTGKARIEGGKLVFEGSGARGTATLHEGGDGRRILSGAGTWVGYSGNTEFELTKR